MPLKPVPRRPSPQAEEGRRPPGRGLSRGPLGRTPAARGLAPTSTPGFSVHLSGTCSAPRSAGIERRRVPLSAPSRASPSGSPLTVPCHSERPPGLTCRSRAPRSRGDGGCSRAHPSVPRSPAVVGASVRAALGGKDAPCATFPGSPRHPVRAGTVNGCDGRRDVTTRLLPSDARRLPRPPRSVSFNRRSRCRERTA